MKYDWFDDLFFVRLLEQNNPVYQFGMRTAPHWHVLLFIYLIDLSYSDDFISSIELTNWNETLSQLILGAIDSLCKWNSQNESLNTSFNYHSE